MKAIVFESPRTWHKWLIGIYLGRSDTVWVIEPFHAYHHNNGIRFYPNHLPRYIKDLIDKGKISLITAQELGSREIYRIAADRAVGIVEQVFGAYKRGHTSIITSFRSILKSDMSDSIFRKQLCHKLGVFYSQYIVIDRVRKKFLHSPVKIFPDINIFFYLFFTKLLKDADPELLDYPYGIFPFFVYLMGFIKNAKNNILGLAGLGIQTLGGLILAPLRLFSFGRKKKSYKYGIAVVSPERQLANNKRGPDFLIDNIRIYNDDVIYFSLLGLSKKEETNLKKLRGSYYCLPDRKWKNFSHFNNWLKLFFAAITDVFKGESIIYEAHLALSEYTRWAKVLNKIEIGHFITHADSGFLHIPRNIALNQNKVQTWFFIDSMNYSFNFRKDENNLLRHPLWAYLYYDHFISWEAALTEYFSSHPNSVNKYFLVGCLWSAHINNRLRNKEGKKDKFVIAVFDTTYSCNSVTSYREGIAFAKDILKLQEEFPDELEIIFKEKKERNMHKHLDAALGDSLLSLYDKISANKNTGVYNNTTDSSEIISFSDMIISFPFTSTTFEALSINKPAIWHDPLGYYKDTNYGRMNGVTTHNYKELKRRILEIMNGQNAFVNPIPRDSGFMDPFRDGKAIERFRELLVKSTG